VPPGHGAESCRRPRHRPREHVSRVEAVRSPASRACRAVRGERRGGGGAVRAAWGRSGPPARADRRGGAAPGEASYLPAGRKDICFGGSPYAPSGSALAGQLVAPMRVHWVCRGRPGRTALQCPPGVRRAPRRAGALSVPISRSVPCSPRESPVKAPPFTGWRLGAALQTALSRGRAGGRGGQRADV
jgi:hypothetical protein